MYFFNKTVFYVNVCIFFFYFMNIFNYSVNNKFSSILIKKIKYFIERKILIWSKKKIEKKINSTLAKLDSIYANLPILITWTTTHTWTKIIVIASRTTWALEWIMACLTITSTCFYFLI